MSLPATPREPLLRIAALQPLLFILSLQSPLLILLPLLSLFRALLLLQINILTRTCKEPPNLCWSLSPRVKNMAKLKPQRLWPQLWLNQSLTNILFKLVFLSCSQVILTWPIISFVNSMKIILTQLEQLSQTISLLQPLSYKTASVKGGSSTRFDTCLPSPLLSSNLNSSSKQILKTLGPLQIIFRAN